MHYSSESYDRPLRLFNGGAGRAHLISYSDAAGTSMYSHEPAVFGGPGACLVSLDAFRD